MKRLFAAVICSLLAPLGIAEEAAPAAEAVPPAVAEGVPAPPPVPVEEAVPFRPPAVPLVTVDPYTSTWSFSDNLYDSWPVHWTGQPRAMAGMIRVDGEPFRFMGPDSICGNAVRNQTLEVLPTRTIYTFEAGAVTLKVTFTTPMLPQDMMLLSLPVTYVSFEVVSRDAQSHDVALYFDASAEWAVNEPKQEVVWDRPEDAPSDVVLMRVGSKEQPVLAKAGDDLRIDWGHLYLAVPKSDPVNTVFGGHDVVRDTFRDKGKLVDEDDTRQPRAANDDWPVLASMWHLGAVSKTPATRYLILAYDEEFAIEYNGEKLAPWWRHKLGSVNAMINQATARRGEFMRRCIDFDEELLYDATSVGGAKYAELVALAYRHTFASGKIVAGPDGTPWYFHKENFSNGCIATVDVSYPASPFFALFSPVLLEGMMKPIFAFAASDAWEWPFAPHDVGTYPKANGQVYGKGNIDQQMPVEECGNMILMAALAVRARGKADFALANWELLTQWADYLKEKGLDPENQLCTDDFAGHLAHNTNLSLKAINALGAYAMMAELLGKPEAAAYRDAAKEMAAAWVKMADDGDHYRLTFDKPGPWSMKYNLVWDTLFKLDLFPAEVAAKEVAYYKVIQNKYGLPLDSRKDYTKADWLVWCATMATEPGDFEALVAPLHTFCQETPDRVPFTDWYDTKTAKCVGFRARPVIGGIYLKVMADPDIWSKWVSRASEG
jgi:hypothetical protein